MMSTAVQPDTPAVDACHPDAIASAYVERPLIDCQTDGVVALAAASEAVNMALSQFGIQVRIYARPRDGRCYIEADVVPSYAD